MRNSTLDAYDYAIFNELYNKPFSSYADLAKRIDLTAGTIRDRIKVMKKSNFIYADTTIQDPIFGNRLKSEIEVRYRPQSIGLIRQHVIFNDIRSENMLQRLKKFCDDHPYTHFRADLYGKGKALYAQFDIPSDIRSIMDNTYQVLVNDLNITDLHIVNEKTSFEGQPNLSNYDAFTGKWIGENENSSILNAIFNNINEYLEEENISEISAKNMKDNSYDIYKLSDLDAKLLRELTINGKISVTDLASYHNVNKSTISRRLSKIMSNVVDSGVLLFNREAFGLNNYQIMIGKFKNNEVKTRLENFITSGVLPINIRLSTDIDLSYNLYSTSNSINSMDLNSILWRISIPQSFHSYQMDTRYFMSYYFYHHNYNEKSGWNINKEYVEYLPK